MARTWPVILVLVLSLSLLACGGRGTSEFVGAWEIDPVSAKKMVEKLVGPTDDEVFPQVVQVAYKELLGRVESMRLDLDIKPDNTFTFFGSFGGEPETTTGMWAAADGAITMTSNDHPEEPPVTATVSGDRLTIKFDNDGEGSGEMAMIRAK